MLVGDRLRVQSLWRMDQNGHPLPSAFFCAAVTALMPSSPRLHQPVELLAGERRFLAAALHLDELARTGHHEVRVHLGVAVLDVFQIEPFLAVHHARR